jgi:hypothetical protein
VSISYSTLVTLLARKLFLKCSEQQDRLSTTLEAIEKSLDVLDSCYQNLVRVSSTPVLYDSPEIRTLCAELIRSRDAVAVVAKKITDVVSEEDDDGNAN